ncbi:MAG: hypothetical protein JNM63_10175 [Spirochaetia bacterium]|nr:hypothetical protein [Spirochaetia bacterium]
MKIVEILKVVSRIIFIVVSRSVVFTAAGILINLILLTFLYPEMVATFSHVASMPVARAGGAGAVIALVFIIFQMWPAWLMLAVLGLGFPALYFFFGHKHAIASALRYLVVSQSPFVLSYLVERLAAFVRSKPEFVEKLRNNDVTYFAREVLPRYLQKLDNMPLLVRVVFRKLLEKIHLRGILEKIVENRALLEGDSEQIQNEAVAKGKDLFDARLPAPSLRWFSILVIVDAAVFTAFKIIF